MRVLHVVHGLARGGLENGVVNLINHLPRDEFRQGVACLDRRGEMANRIRGEVDLFVLERRRHDIRLPFRLAQLLRSWQPDVVHCRNWNTWLDTTVAHLFTGRRGTLVWSFHGFEESGDFPRRRAVASRMLAVATDHLCAVSSDSGLRFSNRTGIDARRFHMIYNGVDLERFHPVADKRTVRNDLSIPERDIIVVTVASLTPIKNHELLLDAIDLLRWNNSTPVRFYWLGDGALKSKLKAKIASLDLQRQVKLVGNSDRVPDYLSAADIFVLPSRLEGMSNAILEAMAAQLPVIANRTGGNPELVVDGETGLLCSPGSQSELAAALQSLCINGELRIRMGQAARDRAKRVFSLKEMAENYAALYRKITTSNDYIATDSKDRTVS